MADPNRPRVAREDVVPEFGQRLIVQCDRSGCELAALMEPRPLFGGRRNWPAEGLSHRFRCQCGHRVAKVTYTRHPTGQSGVISPATIALWY